MGKDDDKRLCARCGQWVPKIGIHPCLLRKNADDETANLTPVEQKIMHKALRASVKIIEEPKPAEPVNVTSIRTARWREKNREKARAYMREYMRKRRQKTEESASNFSKKG